MKNAHIKPGQLVPAELRLEIYKEAKRSIEAGDTNKKYKTCFSINFLFKLILYGKEYNNIFLDSEYFLMFPEFNYEIDFKKRKEKALSELTKAIEALEKETEKPKVVVVGVGQESILYNIANRINDNLNELSFDAALDVYNQIRENMRERREAEIAALEQPKNERLIYLKNIEL